MMSNNLKQSVILMNKDVKNCNHFLVCIFLIFQTHVTRHVVILMCVSGLIC